jgi:hypothetical protein
MPITTSTVIYFCATLTVQAVGNSEVRSVNFGSGEAAEANMEAAGYHYVSGALVQVWSK